MAGEQIKGLKWLGGPTTRIFALMGFALFFAGKGMQDAGSLYEASRKILQVAQQEASEAKNKLSEVTKRLKEGSTKLTIAQQVELYDLFYKVALAEANPDPEQNRARLEEFLKSKGLQIKPLQEIDKLAATEAQIQLSQLGQGPRTVREVLAENNIQLPLLSDPATEEKARSIATERLEKFITSLKIVDTASMLD